MRIIRKFEFSVEDCAVVQRFLDWCGDIEEDSDWNALSDEADVDLQDLYDNMDTLLRYMEGNRWDKGGK